VLQCLYAPLRCDDIYRRQVSILWPPAYKAITISHSDVIHDELGDRRCFRRSAAELHRFSYVLRPAWQLFFFLVLGNFTVPLIFLLPFFL